MKKLKINYKFNTNKNIKELKKYGFFWIEYSNVNGYVWSNKVIKIYSNNGNIEYGRFTQNVLDILLLLASSGFLIKVK